MNTLKIEPTVDDFESNIFKCPVCRTEYFNSKQSLIDHITSCEKIAPIILNYNSVDINGLKLEKIDYQSNENKENATQISQMDRRRLSDHTICNIPEENSMVYKDECVYCFDSLFSICGLFICTKTFIGVCKNHLDWFYTETQNAPFLNIRMERRWKLSNHDDTEKVVGDKQMAEYRQMLQQAYFTKKFDIREIHRLVLMPEATELIIDDSLELPEDVRRSTEAILSADSVAMAIESAWNENDANRNWEDSLCPESDAIEETTKVS